MSLNRRAPVADPRFYKTYGSTRPLATHWVPATCEEVDCEQFRFGWSINVAPLSDQQRDTIRRAGYRYATLSVSAEETQWIFEAGQPCFKSTMHRREVGRPPLFFTRPGDWRGDPTGGRPNVMRPEDWVDDMATHLDHIRTEIEKG